MNGKNIKTQIAKSRSPQKKLYATMNIAGIIKSLEVQRGIKLSTIPSTNAQKAKPNV